MLITFPFCIYEQEEEFEKIMQSLANDVSDTYERIAPRAFKNQVMQTFCCLAVRVKDDFCGQFHSQRLNIIIPHLIRNIFTSFF